MLLGIVAIVWATTLNGIFRFALTGMNRHTSASYSEILCGILCLIFAPCLVSQFGPEYVGFAITIAYCATNLWILPLALARNLNTNSLFPSLADILRLVACGLASLVSGKLIFEAFEGTSSLVSIPIAGIVLIAIYFIAMRLLSPDEANEIFTLLSRLFKRTEATPTRASL